LRRKGDADSDAEARSGASKQVSPGGRPFTEPRGEAAGADDPTYGALKVMVCSPELASLYLLSRHSPEPHSLR